MANRPIFIPQANVVGVDEKGIDFKWHAGMAPSQKKKSIVELHLAAAQLGFERVLEISSKSEDPIGIELSAFNLVITTKKHIKKLTVETAFQGSKVFERGGPYNDLYGIDSRAAKKDIRLKESGDMVRFEFFGKEFPLVPRTYFYDWMYINALVQNVNLAEGVLNFDGFSDIEFNPKKSINCQAHSVALYMSLSKSKVLNIALESPVEFLSQCKQHYRAQKRNTLVQSSMI